MGTFIYHPKNLTSITCNMMTDPTNDYQVDPRFIDFAPDKRLEIIYAQGKVGGAVRGTRAGLAPFKHQVIVKGTSMADALSNARSLLQAIINEDGGYLEYKPEGLAAGVLSTYYHYLKSKPPKLLGRGALTDAVMSSRYVKDEDSTATHFVKYSVELSTEARATSDPETLITITGPTGIFNHDDAGHNNFITVPSSAIKGDAIIPIIEIVGGGSAVGFEIDRLIVHKRAIPVGDTSGLDWIEAEDLDGDGNWAAYVDAAISGGNGANTAQSSFLFFRNLEWAEAYLGKVAAIICAKTSTTNVVYTMFPYTGQAATTHESQRGEAVSNTAWSIYYSFDTLDLPPVATPVYLDDASTPTIGEYLSDGARVGMRVDKVGNGTLSIDFLVFALADDWIAAFETDAMHIDEAGSPWYFAVDAISELSHGKQTADDHFVHSWDKFGGPLSELILEKGFDHKIRFLGWNGSSGYDIDHEFDITVKGIYATIFPFSET